jgi:hypothetical protein
MIGPIGVGTSTLRLRPEEKSLKMEKIDKVPR